MVGFSFEYSVLVITDCTAKVTCRRGKQDACRPSTPTREQYYNNKRSPSRFVRLSSKLYSWKQCKVSIKTSAAST